MTPRKAINGWVLSAAAALAALWSSLACATLGEPESSIQAESQLSRASMKETDVGPYRVHEVDLPSGTVIREYAAPGGNVFAVTWHGPFNPNLRQTLGSYFDEYSAGAQVQRLSRGDRNHLQIRQSDLVVLVGGHMRAYGGRAYLPQSVPSGVVVGELE